MKVKSVGNFNFEGFLDLKERKEVCFSYIILNIYVMLDFLEINLEFGI